MFSGTPPIPRGRGRGHGRGTPLLPVSSDASQVGEAVLFDNPHHLTDDTTVCHPGGCSTTTITSPTISAPSTLASMTQ
ncbi:UNVERIFIED_CONTAM: hypothetical protein Sindi_1837600, partial [Sesamum indicum]